MKKIFISFVLGGCTLMLVNCKPDDNSNKITIRDRQEVYQEDIKEIETFLKTNNITVEDENVTFTSVEEGSTSIWNQTEYTLQSVNFKNLPYYTDSNGELKKQTDNVEYKVYYLIINQGGGETPMIHDNTFTSYTGYKLDRNIFDTYAFGIWSSYPAYSTYSEFLPGYQQILQKIKTATAVVDNGDGTYTYENPGRVIVFIPSGLGYFNVKTGSIGEYEPLIFDIKLIALKEADHDNDGILDKYEDLNGNGDLWDDDTDGDGKANFLDVDDDGDGYTTREEITYTVIENGESIKKIYDFENIPNCENGSLKKHIDKNCH